MNEHDKNYFNNEQLEKALTWLNSKWPIKTCDVCRTNLWELSNFMVAAPRFEGGIVIGGPVAPQLMVMCKNCGNTKFFNAVIMGLVKADKEPSNE